jgi:hypothetical protein
MKNEAAFCQGVRNDSYSGRHHYVGRLQKESGPALPPPPPPPPASISFSPSNIQAGGSASLTWQTTNATDVSIEGIGAVQANGARTVSPTQSMTYHLTAKGAGGTQEATIRLTVTQPPPQPPAAPSISDEDLFNQNIKNIYFDFDVWRQSAQNRWFPLHDRRIDTCVSAPTTERAHLPEDFYWGAGWPHFGDSARQALSLPPEPVN